MLISLNIKNYALIKELHLEPDKHLNIITGETGAGKSIMLGALGLLMGNRADIKSLYDETEKCIVEGTFDLTKLNLKDYFEENDLDYEAVSILRREIIPSGKSRAFVNDTPVNLNILKELGEKVMDIHSQHDTLLLRANNFQLEILDSFSQNLTLLQDYKLAYQNYKKAESELNQLISKSDQLRKEFDYNSFLLTELEGQNLDDLDQHQLEEELNMLENAEEIKSRLSLAFEYLNQEEVSALQLIKEAENSVGSLSNLAEKYKIYKDRIRSVFIELQDITHAIEIENSKIETNNNRLEEVSDSLNNLYKLQKKHSVNSREELIQIREKLASEVSSVLNLNEDIEKLSKKREENLIIAKAKASALSQSRKDSIGSLQSKIISLLNDLGMNNADFKIEISGKELSADGQDIINFLFSANKGITPRSLKDVASGGEFSRLMLSLKYILAQKSELPTIIFDEIDTGISGEIAVKVGTLLNEMANYMQVIAITHLPQIAGRGNAHFYVYKDDSEAKTYSKIKKLSQEERVKEIASMIGGLNPSDNAIKSARELLSI